MRFILLVLVALSFFGVKASADSRLGVSMGASTLNYSDTDKKDVSLKNSFSGLEFVKHDKNGNLRHYFEYRNSNSKSDKTDGIVLHYSSQEILYKIGYAIHGERRGGVAVVPKYFFGLGADEFYFENISEVRESNRTEEASLLEPNSVPHGWEIAVEMLFENAYLEAGLKKYDSTFEIKYLNSESAEIKQQSLSGFLTVGLKWR